MIFLTDGSGAIYRIDKKDEDEVILAIINKHGQTISETCIPAFIAETLIEEYQEVDNDGNYQN